MCGRLIGLFTNQRLFVDSSPSCVAKFEYYCTFKKKDFFNFHLIPHQYSLMGHGSDGCHKMDLLIRKFIARLNALLQQHLSSLLTSCSVFSHTSCKKDFLIKGKPMF